MGFAQFFDHDGSKVSRYEKVIDAGATDEEKREFESQLLVPVALPPYGGAPPTADTINDLTVRIVFPDEESYSRFERHFKISTYVEKSVHEIGLLDALLLMVEKGEIVYDPETATAQVPLRRGHR